MRMCLALLALICGAIDQSTRCSGFPPFCRWIRDGRILPVLPVAGQQHFSLAVFIMERDESGPCSRGGGTPQH